MTCCAPYTPRNRACRIAGRILLGLVLGVALAAAFGAVVMWLWNGTVTALFHLPAIRFGQALALLILARVLVGGHHGWHHGRRGRHGHGGPGEDCRGWWHGQRGTEEPGQDAGGAGRTGVEA